MTASNGRSNCISVGSPSKNCTFPICRARARSVARCTADMAWSATDDLSAWSDQFRGQKSYVSTAATHIKNAHASTDPGLPQQLTCEGLKDLSLTTETIELLLRMT